MTTIDSKDAFPRANNKLDRDLTSLKLGENWMSGITYIRVNSGWVYLKTVIDLEDRKVIGWCVSDDITTERTVIKAWISERNHRSIIDGFIFHLDRGFQYASIRITNFFSLNRKITQSMSRKGNC